MKIGLIDVGGGLRGAFGAGVLDYCLDQNIVFDYAIGVSAGAANVASFLAGQRGRNYEFYTNYFQRWEYMSLKNLVHTGSYIGLDYIYSTLSDHDGDYPLDWSKIENNSSEMLVVATNADTGKPNYFHKSDMKQDQYDAIKASCCVPLVNRPYMIDNVPYYDGGLSDPVPYKKAFSDGCDKVVLILTRPVDFRRIPKNDKVIADLIKRHYPNASVAMKNRSILYNQSVDECQRLEKENKICILAPDDIGHMKTLTKDKESIIALYNKGYDVAKKLKNI